MSGGRGAEAVATPSTHRFKNTSELTCPPLPTLDWQRGAQTQVLWAAEAEFLLPSVSFCVTTQGLWTPFQEPEGQDT